MSYSIAGVFRRRWNDGGRSDSTLTPSAVGPATRIFLRQFSSDESKVLMSLRSCQVNAFAIVPDDSDVSGSSGGKAVCGKYLVLIVGISLSVLIFLSVVLENSTKSAHTPGNEVARMQFIDRHGRSHSGSPMAVVKISGIRVLGMKVQKTSRLRVPFSREEHVRNSTIRLYPEFALRAHYQSASARPMTHEYPMEELFQI